MTDSSARDQICEPRERDREQRVEAIKRWVEFIDAQPPETWGPQQNAVVDGQLEAAAALETTANQRKHVMDVAADIVAERDGPPEGPSR